MSIQSEINRISQNVADSLTAVAAKGVTVPAESTSDDLPDLISQISQGSGSAISVVDTLDSHGGTIRTISAVDLSVVTASASDVASGKIFVASDGTITTGTSSGGGGGLYPWLGSGAVKVGTVLSKTINLANDTTWSSWTPSTTSTTIKAESTTNDITITADIANYDYCIVTKGFIEPVYASGTPTTYRTHRVVQYYVSYYYGYPTNSNISQLQTDTAGTISSLSTTSMFYQYYYNNAGNLTARTATQCGPCYMSQYPSLSAGSVSDGTTTISYKLPAFYAKCDSSRFSTTRAGQIDDANTNYNLTVDLYRVPHGNGLMSHWVSETCAALNAP